MKSDPQLDHLKQKIESAQTRLHFHHTKKSSAKTQSGKFFNVGVELIAGVLIGSGLGLLIDWLFKISPWGLITFFILGSVAGMMNVYRAVTPQKPKDKKKDHGHGPTPSV